MPQHDLPENNDHRDNLIDFGEHLRRRMGRAAQDEDMLARSDREAFRLAENGDGKRPRFGRTDLLWLGMILAIGYIFCRFVLR